MNLCREKACRHAKTLLAAIAAIFLFASPIFAQAPRRTIVDDVGLDQHLGDQIPLDLVFTDEHGKEVALRHYFHDRPVILACVYYRCPMLCTQVLNGLLEAAQGMSLRMGSDYTVLALSIDPRETTAMAAAKKRNYARSYQREGAESGWHFLTGNEASIAALTTAVGFRYRYDAATDQYAHASGIVVLTPAGKISRYFYGIDFPPRDLRFALIESSHRRIGNAVDQVLLLCYHYDPTIGRYGLAIAAALRLAGLCTIGTMGVFLGKMYLLERRRAAELAAFLPQQRSGP